MALPDNELAYDVPAVPSSPLSNGEAEVLPCLFSFRPEDAKAAHYLVFLIRDFKDRLFWVRMEFGFCDVLAINEVIVGQFDESHADIYRSRVLAMITSEYGTTASIAVTGLVRQPIIDLSVVD